jgi:hypothetical protein
VSHFSIFIHEYIIFPLHSPFYTLCLYLPSPTGINPQSGPVLPSSMFERRQFCLFKIAVQGGSLLHFHLHMYLYS